MLRRKSEMITRTNLIKSRGWSAKLISMFAAEPDEYRENPYYRSAPEVQLFDLSRIKRIEKGVRFRREFDKVKARKEAAAKAIVTKKSLTVTWLETLPVPNLPERTEEELTALAVRAYNERGSYNEWVEWFPATLDSDQDFLDRITVNFVRHELTGYENQLMHSRSRVGAAEARHVIRAKILEAISDKYPWLWLACDLQQERYDKEYYGF